MIVVAWEFLAIAALVVGVLALFDAPEQEDAAAVRDRAAMQQAMLDRAHAQHYGQQVKGGT